MTTHQISARTFLTYRKLTMVKTKLTSMGEALGTNKVSQSANRSANVNLNFQSTSDP